MNRIERNILIVGAGPGGLASGMILAHRGFKVTIFEKEKVLGGRSAPIELGGSFARSLRMTNVF